MSRLIGVAAVVLVLGAIVTYAICLHCPECDHDGTGAIAKIAPARYRFTRKLQNAAADHLGLTVS